MKKYALPIVYLLTLSMVSMAQEVQMFSVDNSAFFDEIKGIVTGEEHATVTVCPPSDNREEEYRRLNIKEGDNILFVNGNRINSIKEFKEHYGSIPIGEEVKLGIQRDDQKFIVEFKKGKPFGGTTKIKTDGNEAQMQNSNVEVKDGKVFIDGKEIPADSLKGGIMMFKTEKK